MITDPIVELWRCLEINLCSESEGVSNGWGWETPTGNGSHLSGFACLSLLHLFFFFSQLPIGLSVDLLACLEASLCLFDFL